MLRNRYPEATVLVGLVGRQETSRAGRLKNVLCLPGWLVNCWGMNHQVNMFCKTRFIRATRAVLVEPPAREFESH